MNKNKLSVFIIAKNEEQKIGRALESIKPIADEIVVVDDFSTDKTCKIAKAYKAKIIRHKLKSFSEQKNLAIKNCRNEWILGIDADEILYPETRDEIRKILKNPVFESYYIYRDEFFLNKRMMSAKKIRLYRKSVAHYAGVVHEELDLNKPSGTLKNHFKHEQNSMNLFLFLLKRR